MLKNWYVEEITGEQEAQFTASFLQAHGGQYICKVERRNHKNILGMTWNERVYIFTFLLTPGEYNALMAEL